MEQPITILLADDDEDDCLLFKQAVSELKVTISLDVVSDGEKLMNLLKESDQLPTILFLDMNMPRKDGMACLKEIKQSESLKSTPVIILSTSASRDIIDKLYESGAQYYIRKPNDYSQLKYLIMTAIDLVAKKTTQPDIGDFVLSPEAYQHETK
ncbi:MAG: response regulator [Ferruginibacter sp.]